MKLNQFVIFVLSLFLLVQVSADMAAPPVPPKPPFVKTKIALNWKAEPEFGGFYEAVEMNYYKKANIEMQIQEGGSGTPTLQMLVNSQIDYAIVSSEEILLHNAKDLKRPLVAVLSVFEKAPYMIMSRSEMGFKSLGDMFKTKDQVISVQKGLPYVDYLLKKHGPAVAKIVPYQGGIALFEKNKNYSQQGFITSEFLLAKEKGLNPQAFLVADEGFNPYIGVLAVRRDFLDKNKEQVERVVKATREGWESYLNNAQLTNNKLMSLNPSLTAPAMKQSLAKMKELMQFAPLKFGQMKTDRWKTLETQMLDLKLISRPVDTDKIYQNF